MCVCEPTIYGLDLQEAMEVGREDAPDCCGQEMTTTSRDEYLVHTCGCCKAVVEVDDLGLIDDIRLPADDER